MELTDDELSHLHTLLFDEVLYGDDDVVYGDGKEAASLRSALEKVEDEAKRRKLW